MALPTGMTLRQQTAADIPAMVALVDATWSVLYGQTGYFTVDGLTLGFNRPQRDPERDSPAIVSDDRLIGWARLLAWPPMSEIVCDIVVDLDLPPGERYAAVDALITSLQDAARARLTDAEPHPGRVFGLSVPTQDTGLRDHVRGLGWRLLRTNFELVIDLTEGPSADVEWPTGMTMRTFRDAAVVEPMITVLTDAFADHRGDSPSPDEWHHMLTSQMVLPDVSYLLSDADGPVAGLVSSDFGDGEGYIGAIGVRRRGRGRGAATAMLRRAFHDLAAAGYSTVKLDVDAENATGALRLYQSAGMSVRVAHEAWVTPLHPA